jgi:hypothetical protein
MTQNIPFPVYADSIHYDLKELLVAYDFSEAADASLKYAVMLSKNNGAKNGRSNCAIAASW